MVLRETKRYRYGNGQPRKFYGCLNYPACSGTHGAHPDGRPLGTPGDAETKKWRVRAHKEFNKLYRRNPTKAGRRRAYEILQRLMKLHPDDAHIGKFTITQCKELLKHLKRHTNWRE